MGKMGYRVEQTDRDYTYDTLENARVTAKGLLSSNRGFSYDICEIVEQVPEPVREWPVNVWSPNVWHVATLEQGGIAFRGVHDNLSFAVVQARALARDGGKPTRVYRAEGSQLITEGEEYRP